MRVLSFRSTGAVMLGVQLGLISQLVLCARPVRAQQTPIAYVATTGVTLSGSMSVENGRASIGNDGTITAGDATAMVKLARGGDMEVCASTKVHLSRDTSVSDAADSALMIALDRGALEANYVPGKYSDVLLTPDLRILISGPGTADLKVRVNQQGDTCVDNHGAGAPYVTVTSNFTGGVYRVQPDQRVMFEHGSLDQVVDNETESCGCPVSAPVEVANADATNVPNVAPRKAEAAPEKAKVEAANPFPLAQSEGLAPAPAAPVKPVVPPGTVHAEVQAPIAYDSAVTPDPAAPDAAGKEPVSCKNTAGLPGCPDLTVAKYPGTETSRVAALIPSKKPVQQKHSGFFHSIGHFFSRVFGG